jgi:hypothetical protein
MIGRILVELETPGDSRTMFRLRIDDKVVADGLTAVQAHLLVGEILDRVTLPRRRRPAERHEERQEAAGAE